MLLSPILAVQLAKSSPVAPIIVFAIVIVFTIIKAIIKKIQESNTYQESRQKARKQPTDLWAGHPPARGKAKPPPLPVRPRQVRNAPQVSTEDAAEARRVLEAAMRRQQGSNDSHYNVKGTSPDTNDAEEADHAYDTERKKKDRQRHPVVKMLQGKNGARRAVIAREVLDRPRAFDI